MINLNINQVKNGLVITGQGSQFIASDGKEAGKIIDELLCTQQERFEKQEEVKRLVTELNAA